MKDLIFEIDDYFGESYMRKYQVDMGNLKERVRGVRNKVWGPWKDLTTDSLDFYRMVMPDIMVKRNKIIHNNPNSVTKLL